MQRLGSQYVRIMSYAVREGEDQLEEERFHRLREITKRFLCRHHACPRKLHELWRHELAARFEIAEKCSWSQMGL